MLSECSVETRAVSWISDSELRFNTKYLGSVCGGEEGGEEGGMPALTIEH